MYVHHTADRLLLSGDRFGRLDGATLDTAHLEIWHPQVTRQCRLLPFNFSIRTTKLGGAESSVDDFDICRGDVLIRAVTILRYIESQPTTERFVCLFQYKEHTNIFYTHFFFTHCL